MNAEIYIARVLDQLPPALPRRQQIAMELRGHIAERLAAGQPLDAVLAQLGDPVALAESYVAAVTLISAPHGRRLLAKLIDVGALTLAILSAVALPIVVEPGPSMPFLMVTLSITVAIAGFSYLAVAEWRYGQTIGKRLFGLRVVRESGTRISLGQAVVRQMPMFFQFAFIDALFVLFTDRRQRAFELLTKTRVVTDEATDDAAVAASAHPA